MQPPLGAIPARGVSGGSCYATAAVELCSQHRQYEVFLFFSTAI